VTIPLLFQLALATASKTIDINSPYFLPDRSARRELIAAAARGVRVRLIVPGKYNNDPIARIASRRHYGELLSGGVEIFEYEPGMIHAKIVISDTPSWDRRISTADRSSSTTK
jgi:cardiolipin synthase